MAKSLKEESQEKFTPKAAAERLTDWMKYLKVAQEKATKTWVQSLPGINSLR